eukprot:COSAG02_NODE_542_length_20590_cov_9.193060_6_plen_33_part_00
MRVEWSEVVHNSHDDKCLRYISMVVFVLIFVA